MEKRIKRQQCVTKEQQPKTNKNRAVATNNLTKCTYANVRTNDHDEKHNKSDTNLKEQRHDIKLHAQRQKTNHMVLSRRLTALREPCSFFARESSES